MRLKIITNKITIFVLVFCMYLLLTLLVWGLFALALIYLVPETVTAWIITFVFCLGLYCYLKLKIAELTSILSRKIKDKETEKAEF